MIPSIRISQIPEFSQRYYDLDPHEDVDLDNRRDRIRREQKLRFEDLCAVCDWKSPRSAGHARKNTEQEVEEITEFALRAKSERARVEGLQLLRGVSYPTASVILHFFHEDTYPILDFRALESMNIDKPTQYTFDFWWKYVESCRAFYANVRRRYPRLSIRELDRALWQYSKEEQDREDRSSAEAQGECG